MNVNLTRGGKTLPVEAPAFPPKVTEDKATEHWGRPLSFEQGAADMQGWVHAKPCSPAGTRAAPAQAAGITAPTF